VTILTPLFLLRRATDEPDPTTYTDAELTERLTDAGNDVNVVARDIWQEKLAAASTFVNVSEGGSSRSLSQAYDHAKEMLAYYQDQVDQALGGTVLRKLVRP
jgi:hypothetical protein